MEKKKGRVYCMGFFEETNGTYEIIDGQQRIVSLVRFYNNEYKG